MVWLEAPIAGTFKSARSIGPALVTLFWQDQWLYCIAPPLGQFAVGAFRLLTIDEREILTENFSCSTLPLYFQNVKVPHHQVAEPQPKAVRTERRRILTKYLN